MPSNGTVEVLAKKFDKFFTRGFSKVSSISSKMVERIKAKGHVRSDVVLFPNWSDVEAVRPALREASNGYREEFGLTNKTVLLYSGNMGTKQGLEVLTPLVEAFKDDAGVHFLFCGDGIYRQELGRLVGGKANVTMLPLQPNDRMNELLNAADIHLLPQMGGVADLVMPSKLTGIMASGRPVIAMADEGTQVAEVVTGCGLVVSPDDVNALCAAARRLVESVELRSSLGLAAREYAVKFLSKERVLRRFELDMMSLLTPPEKREEVQLARSYRG